MSAPREWHPHPLDQPGLLVVGLVHLLAGAYLLLDHYVLGRFDGRWVGFFASLGLALVAGALFLLTGRRARWRSRLLPALSAPMLSFVVWFVIAVRFGLGAERLVFGAILAAVGITSVAASEIRRRRVIVTLSDQKLVVFVRRYRIEHELPLEAIREVKASRSWWGRLWGFGDFAARVRKGTMTDNLSKPLVGEEPPERAAAGSGWDEEERFHLVAAHPYKKVRRDLENRILLARMPPKERQEQELAHRLAEDLEGLGT